MNRLAEQIVVHEMAAGSGDGELLELELSADNLGDHRVRPKRHEHPPSDRHLVQVRSERIDTICAGEINENLFMWIDVQGFEGFVLAGATELLARRVPTVLEFWPRGMAASGSFALLESNLAHYREFIDLDEPSRARPISELRVLHDKIGANSSDPDSFTDILVL